MQEQDPTKVETGSHYDFVGSFMRGDKTIWGVYIFLVLISAVEIFSATSQLTYRGGYASDPAFRHITFLLAGAVMLLISQSMSLTSIRSWDKLLYVGGICLCLATWAFGKEQKGATRSIAGLQPVEVCKLGTIMVLCALVTARDTTFQYFFSFYRSRTQLYRFLTYIAILIPVLVLIAPQNLSSGLIIAMASFGVMFLGGVNGRYLWWLVGAGIAVGILALVGLKILYEHEKANQVNITETERVDDDSERSVGRATTWANRIYDHSGKPLWEENIHGKKSQEIYSHMAIANSYPFGRFVGNSKMRDFLPEAFSDYIFAIIFEEGGPLMALLVLSLYLILFVRCYILSRRTESNYIRLMMVGLPLIIVIQALIHIGVCTGAMFVTGQPLPLISRGGSSIIFTSISFGIILALSRIIRQEQLERAELATQESLAQSPGNDEEQEVSEPEV